MKEQRGRFDLPLVHVLGARFVSGGHRDATNDKKGALPISINVLSPIYLGAQGLLNVDGMAGWGKMTLWSKRCASAVVVNCEMPSAVHFFASAVHFFSLVRSLILVVVLCLPFLIQSK